MMNKEMKQDHTIATSFEREEQELAGIFSEFRESVQSWSSDVMSRERRVVVKSGRRALHLRLATFAMTAVVLVSIVTGGVVQHERSVRETAQVARQKADQKRLEDQRIADRQKAVPTQSAASRGDQDDQLLSDVDSDVAQDSPAAMAPLASLMAN